MIWWLVIILLQAVSIYFFVDVLFVYIQMLPKSEFVFVLLDVKLQMLYVNLFILIYICLVSR